MTRVDFDRVDFEPGGFLSGGFWTRVDFDSIPLGIRYNIDIFDRKQETKNIKHVKNREK